MTAVQPSEYAPEVASSFHRDMLLPLQDLIAAHAFARDADVTAEDLAAALIAGKHLTADARLSAVEVAAQAPSVSEAVDFVMEVLTHLARANA